MYRIYFILAFVCIRMGFFGTHCSQDGIQLNKELTDKHQVFIKSDIWQHVDRGLKYLTVSKDDQSGSITSCSSPSSQWLRAQFRDVPSGDISNYFDWYVYIIPFAYKLFIESPTGDDEYFGIYGDYTEEIILIHNRTEDFWHDAGFGDLGDIVPLGAHGIDLADRNKLIPTLELLFEGSYDEFYTVQDHADDIQDLITRLPDGYDNPLLTFNAFATDEIDDSNPSIIIGDGYFSFQEFAGTDSEGPEYAHTHEYAHHLQYAFGIKDNDGSLSQFSRRQELMADAFSAYFLYHDSGGNMTSSEITTVHTIAYSVGDCETSNDLHHGTPTQRRCATSWGASMAEHDEGSYYTPAELAAEFDEWLQKVDDLDENCDFVASAATFYFKSCIILLQAFAVIWFLLFSLI